MMNTPFRTISVLITLTALLALAIPAGPPAGAQGDWQPYDDPSGIHLQYPADWTLQASEGTIVIADPLETSFVVVMLFPAAPGYTSATCLTDAVGVLGDALPGATITASQQNSTDPDESVGNLSYNAPDGAGFGSMLCQVANGQGLLTAGATPVSRYDAVWPVILQIAESVTLGAAASANLPAPSPDAALTYAAWTDPVAGAFALELPQGWMIDGGLAEMGGQPRPVVQAVSPDQNIMINVGLGELVWFLPPSPDLAQAGYAAGSVVHAQEGFALMVAAYVDGGAGAAFLAEWLIGSSCDRYEATYQYTYEDRTGYDADGSYVSAGEVAYMCELDGQPLVGYLYTNTRAFNHPSLGQVWMYDTVLGYVALEARANEAGAVLMRAAQSFTLNPDWVAAQQALAAQPVAAPDAGWIAPPTGDTLDAHTMDVLMEVNQMMHDTSMIIIDNIDGYSDYEYVYEEDYGW